MIKLILNCIPPSVNAIWRNAGKRTYKTAKGKDFETQAKIELAQQYKKKPLSGALKVMAVINFKDNRKRDIDNYNKGLLDALTGIVWIDDSQIKELTTIKNTGMGKNWIDLEIEEI